MSAGQLRSFLADLLQKLTILSGPEALEARAWAEQRLHLYSAAKAAEFRKTMPDILQMTAPQVEQALEDITAPGHGRSQPQELRAISRSGGGDGPCPTTGGGGSERRRICRNRTVGVAVLTQASAAGPTPRGRFNGIPASAPAMAAGASAVVGSNPVNVGLAVRLVWLIIRALALPSLRLNSRSCGCVVTA